MFSMLCFTTPPQKCSVMRAKRSVVSVMHHFSVVGRSHLKDLLQVQHLVDHGGGGGCVCVSARESTCPGGVPAWGVYLPGGILAQEVYLSGGVPARGGPRYPPLWTEFLTHTTENITLLQLRCGR